MTADASITPPAVQQYTPGEQFVRAFYAAWNVGGWPAVEPLLDEQFEDHASPPEWRFGRAGFRAARQASTQVLRDVQIQIAQVFTWTPTGRRRRTAGLRADLRRHPRHLRRATAAARHPAIGWSNHDLGKQLVDRAGA